MLYFYYITILLYILSNSSTSFGYSHVNQKYSFCSENNRYVFTTLACPGGILLKEPMVIDEPCHCFGSDLMIFEDCTARSNVTSGNLISYSGPACSRDLMTSVGKSWSGKARLLLPMQSFSTPSKQGYCQGLPRNCKHSRENSAIQNPGFVITEIEDLNPFLSPRKGRKVKKIRSFQNELPVLGKSQFIKKSRYRRDSDVTRVKLDIMTEEAPTDLSKDDSSTDSSIDDTSTDSSKDDKTDSSNEASITKTSSKEQTGEGSSEVKNPSKSKNSSTVFTHEELKEKRDEVIKMLEMLESIERNRKAQSRRRGSPGGSLADPSEMKIFKFLERAFEIFKKLAHANVIKDEIIDEIFEVFRAIVLNDVELYNVINLDDKITQEMFQVVQAALVTCENDVGNDEFVFEESLTCPPRLGKLLRKDGNVVNMDLISTMPQEYRYVPDSEDLILGATWKIIDAVHARCYGLFNEIGTGRVPYFFWSFLENFFLTENMKEKFYPANSKGTSTYEAFIETDLDFSLLMENVDTLVAAIHTGSRFPGYFHKPGKPDVPNVSESSESTSPSPEQSEETTAPQTNTSRRKKRSVGTEDFQIWGGRAYCLQKLDYFKPPGFDNSFPKIDYLCKQSSSNK